MHCPAPIRHRALAATLLALATAAASASPANCPQEPARTLVERFMAADCAHCWAGTKDAAETLPAGTLTLDWIVPTGTDAALAAAALPEARSRPGSGATRTHVLRERLNYTVSVSDGIPLQGYIGLSLGVCATAAAPPQGLVGYIALVERIGAGDEGNAQPRHLVRSLVGPLHLGELAPQRPSLHTLATRVPDTPRTDRLSAVGWIESAQGEVLAAAAAIPLECRALEIAKAPPERPATVQPCTLDCTGVECATGPK